MSEITPALALSGVNQHYGYVKALSEIDFHVNAGEIVALLGDNGAGKSTLLKVLSGAHIPTSGTISVRGNPTKFVSPRDAATAGIQMVYQDLALVEAQDIATNLNLGREPMRKGPLGWLGVVDRKAMRQESERELALLGVRTAPMNRPVEMLSGGQRQVIAIARSAVRVTGMGGGAGGGVLLLDEPTAALGYEQTRLVEGLIRNLAASGIAIVLVTHNFPLCFSLADRIVVLNRGRKVADVDKVVTNNDEVVSWVTGARPSMFGEAVES
jgi:simple sugar transport system ATP-binding protein